MNKVLSFLVLSGTLLLLWQPAAAQREARGSDVRTRDVYVSVVDEKGQPVKGLGPKDFVVREDGVAREVVGAVPAEGPMEIVLLVDDSQAAANAIPHIREGLTRFVERMQGKARIGIVTIGERPTNVAERTTDVEALKSGIGRIFARPGTGAYLLQGLSDVARGFQKRDVERPVIIAVTTEGIEFSNEQAQPLVKDLRESGAIFHALALGAPSSSLSDEMRNRNIVLSEATEQTGGRRQQLLTEMALPGTLERLADELQNQYVVTYGRPESLVPPEKIEVRVTRPGAEAHARTRVTGR